MDWQRKRTAVRTVPLLLPATLAALAALSLLSFAACKRKTPGANYGCLQFELLYGRAAHPGTVLLFFKLQTCEGRPLQDLPDEDLVVKEERVCGAVINWAPIAHLPREISCLDPVAISAPVVIDATGHEAIVVKKLEQRGLIKTKGEGALWIEKSEDLIVEYTGEAYPGLIVTGMAVGTVYGLPRMGPTFGSMFLSGEVAAKVTLEKLK